MVVLEQLRDEGEEIEGVFYDERNMIMIHARVLSEGRTALRALLTHELCHMAVTDDDHGERWCDQMLAVVDRAEELGEFEVAEELLVDVAEELVETLAAALV